MASPDDASSLLDRIAGIRRYREGGFVAPNKPVTLLWALARLEEGDPRLVPFSQFEEELRPLLRAAGRPKTLPVHAFWALQTDGLWEVVAEGELTGRAGSREPTAASLRELASGGFSEDIFAALRASPSLREAVSALLREQLRESAPGTVQVPPAASARQTVERLVRDPAFRRGVLDAYDPDRRVLVSPAWENENRGAMPSLADHAGAPLPESLDPVWAVRDEHLAWHRENVFLG